MKSLKELVAYQNLSGKQVCFYFNKGGRNA